MPEWSHYAKPIYITTPSLTTCGMIQEMTETEKGDSMTTVTHLNEAQRAVVTDTTHHLIVNAPAGTGKTHTLACRIAYILDHCQVPPSSLLCLTFTNRACKELKKRIIEDVHEKGLDVVVKTIHSFCYALLREETRTQGDVDHDFLVYDDEDCKTILRDLTQSVSFITSDKDIQKLQNFIEIIKKDVILHRYATGDTANVDASITAFLRHEEEVATVCANYDKARNVRLEQWLTATGRDLYRDYTAKLQENHALDFTDLIVTAYTYLLQPDIERQWRNRFTYIAIDEMQDTSDVEYRLLCRLFPGRIILLCGDYFQTIYSWRGSRPDTILAAFRKDYSPREITFTINYRATQTLLHASRTCLHRLFPAQLGAVYPHPTTAAATTEGDPIILHGATNWLTEGQYIFSQIAALPPAERTRCCILTRTNRANQQIWLSVRAHNARLPVEQQLPFTMIDQFQLFKRQECKDIIAFLRLLVQRHDAISLTRITKRFVPRIGKQTIGTILSPSYRRLGIRMTDFLDEGTHVYGDSYGLLLEALRQERLVVFDVESTGTDTSRDDIIQIAAIRLDGTGQVCQRFMTYVKPTKPVGTSYYVHHISDEKLAAQGVTPAEGIGAFLEFAKDAVIVGHNVTYDLAILYSEMQRLRIDGPATFPYYDTLDIFRRYYPQFPHHTLQYLSESFHLDDQPSHDAFDDILATAGLLRYALDHHIRPDTVKRRAALAMYLPLFTTFSRDMAALRQVSYTRRPYELIEAIMKTPYVKPYYEDHLVDTVGQAVGPNNRMENLRKLYQIAKETDDASQNPRDGLRDFLTLTSLSNSELDTLLAKKPRIPIITVHQAKGLEFEYVFLASLQDGTFPVSRATGPELEEEKRLFYVAMTRAKKRLWLTWHTQEQGRIRKPSPFLEALDRNDTQET